MCPIKVAEGVVAMVASKLNRTSFLSLQKDKREELSKASLNATTVALKSFIRFFLVSYGARTIPIANDSCLPSQCLHVIIIIIDAPLIAHGVIDQIK